MNGVITRSLHEKGWTSVQHNHRSFGVVPHVKIINVCIDITNISKFYDHYLRNCNKKKNHIRFKKKIVLLPFYIDILIVFFFMCLSGKSLKNKSKYDPSKVRTRYAILLQDNSVTYMN